MKLSRVFKRVGMIVLLIVIVSVGSYYFMGRPQELSKYLPEYAPEMIELWNYPYGDAIQITDPDDIQEFYEIFEKYETAGYKSKANFDVVDGGWVRKVYIGGKEVVRIQNDRLVVEKDIHFDVKDIEAFVNRMQAYDRKMRKKYEPIEK